MGLLSRAVALRTNTGLEAPRACVARMVYVTLPAGVKAGGRLFFTNLRGRKSAARIAWCILYVQELTRHKYKVRRVCTHSIVCT